MTQSVTTVILALALTYLATESLTTKRSDISGTSSTVTQQYLYDDLDRQTGVTTSVDGVEMARTTTSYDDKGRVATTAMSDVRGTYRNTLSYAYLTNGMAKGIKSSTGKFEMTLGYTSGVYPSYSGNVSMMTWKGSDGTERIYNYRYDKQNRLTLADYGETIRHLRSGMEIMGTPDYSVNYSYDLHGNVRTIQRNGMSGLTSDINKMYITFDSVDELTLSYNGNQLKNVADTAPKVYYTGATDFEDGADEETEYEYDCNGNMTVDRNRGIVNIVYNRLNLPVEIEFESGHKLENSYDADGNLHRRIEHNLVGNGQIRPGIRLNAITNPADTVIYSGPWQYLNGTLDRIHIPGGYIKENKVYFYIHDHQGNIRQVWNASTNRVVQDNHYYPYGTLFGECAATEYINHIALITAYTSPSEEAEFSADNDLPNNNSSSNNLVCAPQTTNSTSSETNGFDSLTQIVETSDNAYRYGGKEWITYRGLNTYDFTARLYDPALGRFHNPDPLNSTYPHLSPYLYCTANPINATDPTGLKWDLSGLSDDELQSFNEMMERHSENTELSYIYEQLEQSELTFKVQYLESLQSLTVENDMDNPSIYFDAINGRGGTLYISKSNPPQLLTFAEDLFHCFQHNEISLFLDDYNYEFEAKLFAGLVYQVNPNGADMRSEFVKDIIDFLQVSEFEGTYGDFFKIKLGTKDFNKTYLNKLDSFVNYNIQNHIGNLNYRTPSDLPPECLYIFYNQFKIP